MKNRFFDFILESHKNIRMVIKDSFLASWSSWLAFDRKWFFIVFATFLLEQRPMAIHIRFYHETNQQTLGMKRSDWNLQQNSTENCL